MDKEFITMKENMEDIAELSKKILDFVNKYCEEKCIEEVFGFKALEIILVSMAIANDIEIADFLADIVHCHIFVSSHLKN